VDGVSTSGGRDDAVALGNAVLIRRS